MRKSSRSRRGRRVNCTRPELDVVTQLQCAVRNPGAAALGAAIGGIVPWFAREIAHRELPQAIEAGHRWLALAELIVVAGCAAFSILTVYKFGRAAFSDARKAAGFCAALEGVMLVTSGATGLVALLVLIAINAVVNGCSIAIAHEATIRRREADGRRQATRAQTRASKRQASHPRPIWAAASPVSQAPTIVALTRRGRSNGAEVYS